MVNKKIVLIQAPIGDGSKVLCERKDIPFGIAYVAKSLLNAGYEVEILDIYGSLFYNNSPFLERKNVIEAIKNIKADYIGISALSTQFAYVKWLASEIKKYHKKPLILGGKLPTYSAKVVLEHIDVDVCVVGEGEQTMVDLLKNIDTLDKVVGIAYKKDGEIIITKGRQYIENIDDIGFPPYELFDMSIYTDNFLFHSDRSINKFGLGTIGKKYKAVAVLTGRGCPYSCNFCSKSFMGFRFRSVDNIIEEIKYLKDNYNVDAIHFADELAVWQKKRTRELIRKIKPLNVLWDCQARVNTVDYELLKEMKSAGCIGIGFGVESGSNDILKRMDKRITAEESEASIKAAMQVGLTIKIQLMLGYPGETRATAMKTVELMKRCCTYGRRMAIVIALPGSQLYVDAFKQGLIKNEVEYLEKIMMGYGGAGPIAINFTDMNDEELLALKNEAEKMMSRNYMKYLLQHPVKLTGIFIPIIIDAVRLPFFYISNSLVRQKTHQYLKKMFFSQA